MRHKAIIASLPIKRHLQFLLDNGGRPEAVDKGVSRHQQLEIYRDNNCEDLQDEEWCEQRVRFCRICEII